MATKIATEPGFYAGRFRKGGQPYPADAATADPVDLGALTKDELLALAADRGLAAKPSDTKAEIVSILTAAS